MSDYLNFHSNPKEVNSNTNIVKDENEFNISVEDEPFYTSENSVEQEKNPKSNEDNVEKNHAIYGYVRSTEAAEILGMSTTLLRQLTDTYSEFLNVEFSAGGWRKYSNDDINKLEGIVKTKKEKGLTDEQMIEYLKTNSMSKVMIAGNDTQKMEALFGVLTETMGSILSEGMLKISSDINKQLENYQKNMLEQKDDDVKETLKKQEEIIQELQKQMDQKDELIFKLLNETKDNQKIILEKMEEKKKKKFLFFKS